MSADLVDSAVPDGSGADLAVAEVSVPLGADPFLGEIGDSVVEVIDPLETWAAVLDSLEAAVDDAIAADLAAEDLDETDLIRQTAVPASWTPPVAIGPLPEALVDRARHINERQQSAAAQLAGELRTLRQHRAVLGSVQTATAPQQQSVYLDVTG